MDRDFWWHVKAGEIFWTTHQWITLDPFAYAREGLPYLATHEWLAQIILYLVYKTGGATAIILFRGCIASVSIGLLLLLAKKQHIAYALLGIWAVVLTKGSYLERPQLFTFLFFAAFLHLAFRLLDAESNRVRAWICATFVGLELLWVNMHGGAALVGFAIVGCLLLQTIGTTLVEHTFKKKKNNLWLLVGTLITMAIVLVLPPNGFGSIAYLTQLLNDKTIAFIAEWQPRDWALYVWELWPFYVASFGALFVGRRHWVFNGLLLVITAYLSRQAFRHEILFIFTALATFYYQFDRSEVQQRIFQFWRKYQTVSAICFVFLVSVMAHTVYQRSFAFERQDNLFRFGQFDLARDAFDFIEREHITGNMFNTYGIGGYLIYRGYPERKVFIDGRNVDYGFEYMARAYTAGNNVDRWEELEHRYNFTYAVVDYDAIKEKDRLPYASILDADPTWALVHLDDWVAVYLKKTPENQSVIDRFAYTQVNATHLQFNPSFSHVNKAEMPTVIRELTHMRQESVGSVKPIIALATIALKDNRLDDALAFAAQATAIRPYDPEPYAIVAGVALAKQQWEDAAQAYASVVRLAGDNYPDINYAFIADVFEKAGHPWKAWYYRLGLSAPLPTTTNADTVPERLNTVNPVADAEDFHQKALSLVDEGKLEEAEQTFLLSLTMNPSVAEVWSNLCAVRLSLDKNTDAIEACKQALQRDDALGDTHYNLAVAYYRVKKMEEATKELLLAKEHGRVTESDELLYLIKKQSR